MKPKIVTRKPEQIKPTKIVPTIRLDDFCRKRNKILIQRNLGGLGDILMHRMIFEDFKRIMPEAEIHFACPQQYHPVVKDHPFIDKVLDHTKVDLRDYMVSYNTTTACIRHEIAVAPLAGTNRSDIWAQHCGVYLTRHNMHIRLTDEEKKEGRDLIESKRDREGPSVAVVPISAMQIKNLQENQLLSVIDGLRDRGCYPFGLHSVPIPLLCKRDIPTICEIGLRKWMAVIDQMDYMIAVDTAAYHCAGGMHKPVVGLFTFANTDTYAMHYPKAEMFQGPCPVGYAGCYNWSLCPVKTLPKPCLTGMTPELILEKFDTLMKKYPVT